MRKIERKNRDEEDKRGDSWERNSQERAALGHREGAHCPLSTGKVRTQALRGPACGETARSGQERPF